MDKKEMSLQELLVVRLNQMVICLTTLVMDVADRELRNSALCVILELGDKAEKIEKELSKDEDKSREGELRGYLATKFDGILERGKAEPSDVDDVIETLREFEGEEVMTKSVD